MTAAASPVCASFGDLGWLFCRSGQLSEGRTNNFFWVKLHFVVLVRFCMMVITDTDKTKSVLILGGHFVSFFGMGV